MGIKGIYRELGPGQRISLAKLATESLENTGRPLRVAIDIAIWQFQTQTAKGGTNPAIRTLFYRLVRLVGLPVQPVFVFDGPNKPLFKRNKRSGRGDGIASAMAKRLIRLFGFPIHQAPGEAEAECALLQQEGLVDAVLSEDVDTIMFGCSRTFRNWSAEGSRGGKSPTHVTVYDTNEQSLIASGLDRQGMVLVALMSGGDYLPEGVPGCGLKLACEVARAGFGKSLCSLKAADKAGMGEWRANLTHELRTNENKFFRTKHKAIVIPDNFPDVKVLRFYTHPAVSSQAAVKNLIGSVEWSRPVDIGGLRRFTDEIFDWTNRPGAVKLIKVLSPNLLAQKLFARYDHTTQSLESHSLESLEQQESALVQRITARRSHFSTDGIPELRVSHVPAGIVPLDLSQESDEVAETGRQGLALNSDDEFEVAVPSNNDVEAGGQVARKTFDPTAAQAVWLPESLVKLGVPLCVEDWEERQRAKTNVLTASNLAKQRKKKTAGNDTNKPNTLDQWVKSTKSKPRERPEKNAAVLPGSQSLSHFKLPQPLPSSITNFRGHQPQEPATSKPHTSPNRPLASLPRSKPLTSKSARKATTIGSTQLSNPWAFSGSQHTPRTTKPDGHTESFLIETSPEAPKDRPVSLDVKWNDALNAGMNNGPRRDGRHSQSSGDEDLGTARHNGVSASDNRLRTRVADPSRSEPKMMRPLTTSKCTTKASQSSAQPEAASSGSVVSRDATSPSRHKHAGRSHIIERPARPHGPEGRKNLGAVSSATRSTSKGKLIAPRISACGFFKEIDLEDDEAAQLMVHDAEQRVGHQRATSTQQRIWNQSHVAVIDLTGED
ncbi:hypothetical protein BN1723_004598 [Verticillium longisporum]|uniref:XPG-I domain-containing protein n=1 Tax=Verticillium longisporum TaxID=100787 RepID=A0A0G4MZS8_VERLO|nr:hypothetical protein BN1723_004598 [Verticillium longisporum]